MSITASEIQNVRFGEARRGYNPDEVDEFLEKVATDVDALNRALAEAASRLSAAEDRATDAEQQLANKVAEVADLKASAAAAVVSAPVAPKPTGENTINEDVISRAFIAAQISADNLKEEARKEAEKLYREADVKAKDIVRDAHSERERILTEIENLRETSERFRTEFLSLVNHYSADAQKRFAQFGELVPTVSASSTEPSQEAMLSAGNAVVSAASASATAGSAASARQVSAGSSADLSLTASRPTLSASALGDDLEIEEID